MAALLGIGNTSNITTYYLPHNFFRKEDTQRAIKLLDEKPVLESEIIKLCKTALKEARKEDFLQYHPDKWNQRQLRLESSSVFNDLMKGYQQLTDALSGSFDQLMYPLLFYSLNRYT